MTQEESLTVANQALHEVGKLGERLDMHLTQCNERESQRRKDEDRLYNAITNVGVKLDTGVQRVHTRIDSQLKLGLSIGGTLILILLGVIGTLLMKGVPWGTP